MKKIFYLFSFCVLSQAAALAQTPAPRPTPTPADRDDVVVINTNLIQIDATITDKDGRVVPDLRAEDFEVYQNGKLQPITNFSFITLEREKREAQPAGDDSPGNVPAQPGGIRHEQVRRTIALVVDDLGLSHASTQWTKDALRKFVNEQLQPGDLAAIIRTSSGVGALQQFTTDRRLLHAAIDRIRWNARGRTGSFNPIEPSLSESLSNAMDLTRPIVGNEDDAEGGKRLSNVEGMREEREMMRDSQEFQEGVFAAGTLGAVNFVMRGMGQLPGRKAVILFSDGFKLFSRKGQIARVREGLRRLADTANRSGVIIYTMDARGLDVPMLSAQDNTIGLTTEQVDTLMDERRADYFDTQQSLRQIARITGGFAIVNQNDLSKGIERILDDQKGYYLIGYRPDADIFDIEKRRFNELTVKLRRPGLRIRYRSGFFGITDAEANPAPRTPTQQLISALTSPFASKDIDLRLTALFASDSANNTFMRSLIYIKGADLKFKEEADGWHKAEFNISVLTFDDAGEVVDQINRLQSIRAKAADLQDLHKYGLVCSVTLPIQKPGAYQMRVAVRDAVTARIGSASQYIEVPNVRKKNLTLSGVVLEKIEPAGAAGGMKALELKMQRDAAMRRYGGGDTVRFALSVYNARRDKATQRPSLVMQYKIFRDGKEMFASSERPFEIGQTSQPQVVDAAGAFTLGRNMTPGDYVLQVVIRDLLAKDSRQAATQWTDFEIVR